MNATESSVTSQHQQLPKTLRYITAALLTFTCVLGLTGYSVMIVVIWKTQHLGGAIHAKLGGGGNDGGSRALLLNAYVAGLIGSGVVIPVYIANISGGSLVIPILMCKIFGFLNVLTFNALLTTSVAIAIRQCLLLVTKTYGRYSDRKSLLIIVATWSVPMVMAVSASPYVGFNVHLLNCLFEDSRGSASTLLPIFLITIPALSAVVTIFVCYILLFQATKKQQKSIQPCPLQQISTVTGGNPAVSTSIASRSFWTPTNARNARLAVKLCVNWMIFASLWSPLAFMYIVSIRFPASPESWLVGSLLARLFYGMGWALFGIWNERLRQTLRTVLLGKCYDRRKEVAPFVPRTEELVASKPMNRIETENNEFIKSLSNFQVQINNTGGRPR